MARDHPDDDALAAMLARSEVNVAATHDLVEAAQVAASSARTTAEAVHRRAERIHRALATGTDRQAPPDRSPGGG